MASTKESQVRRASRVRSQIKAVANGRPRLSVHRSSKNIYAQIIDDVAGKLLPSASWLQNVPSRRA
jgi:large subunit ribosomal protein L18